MVGRVRVGWEGWSRVLGGRAELLALDFYGFVFFPKYKKILKSLFQSILGELAGCRVGVRGPVTRRYISSTSPCAVEGN